MAQLWMTIITTVCTVAASLLVTYIFNKVSGLPKKLSDEKKAREKRVDDLEIAITTKYDDLTTKVSTICTRLDAAEEAIGHYPEYREQSLNMQHQLQQQDINILDVCNSIKNEVAANRVMLDSRLKSLEEREKNALREKIYHLWRTFTDLHLNPMQAWTDMERHSFYELVKDYESLGGNDYVHQVILPAMTRLSVISMEDLNAVKELFESRTAKHISSCDNASIN